MLTRIWKYTLVACVATGLAFTRHALADEDDAAREPDAVDEAVVEDDGVGNDVVAEKAGECAEQAAAVRARPDAFPSVTLAGESIPRFAIFRADPWGKNNIYLLFDGEVTNGYNRMYVWVPEHRQFDRPTAMTANADGWFPEMRFEETHDGQRSEVTYRFRFTRQTQRHGGPARSASTRTEFDYLTGQTRTISVPARPATPVRIVMTPVFSMTCNFMRDRSPLGGPNRLAVSLSGHIGSVAKFEDLKGASAPWQNVRFNAAIQRDQHTNPHEAILSIRGSVNYGGHGRCVIQALPTGFMDVTVDVNPYMKQPLFSRVLDGMDLIRDGGEANVPFGWYTASWRVKLHPWLGGREYKGGNSLMSLSRSEAATTAAARGTLGGDSPASRLRGPPPSQLRGPGR